MLSYQHSYHAGNHADVIKHVVMIAVLTKLTKKSKPLFFLDTHSGEGLYSFDDGKSNEHEANQLGVFSFYNQLSTDSSSDSCSARTYLKMIKEFLANKTYPGSPLIATRLLRDTDVFHSNELHPIANARLKECFKNTNVSIHKRDAFECLNGMLPPRPNRGAVLIDPPYEQVAEYELVEKTLSKVIRKWQNGCFMIWYPLIAKLRIDRQTQKTIKNPKYGLSEKMISRLSILPVKSMLNIVFEPYDSTQSYGMYGSGVCVINPPWQVEQDLESSLSLLSDAFKTKYVARCRIEWIIKAT